MVKSKRSVQLSRRFLKRDFLKLDIRESSANTYYTSFLTLETEYGSNPLIKLYTDGLDDIIDFINNKYGSRGERFKSSTINNNASKHLNYKAKVDIKDYINNFIK